MPEIFSLGDDPRGSVDERDGGCPSWLRRLRQAAPPPTALRAPTRPAPGRLPIALLRLPAPPPGGRLPTPVAAVPRLRHQRREGLAAAFQQTLPRPRPRPPTWRLRRMGISSIVGRAHRRRLSSSAGQVSEESFTLSSEANARLLRPASRLTASLYSRDSSIRYRPAWTSHIGDPDRRLWTRGPPPRWTSFKPAPTAEDGDQGEHEHVEGIRFHL